MGAERAVIGSGSGGQKMLNNFQDEIVATVDLGGERGDDRWILMGRVLLFNVDGDWQNATVKLVDATNKVIDEENFELNSLEQNDVHLQGGYIPAEKAIVTLQCNTYNGRANFGSIVAIKVDDIDWQ